VPALLTFANRSTFIRRLFVLAILTTSAAAILLQRSGSFVPPTQAVSSSIVISQIYGGGGNTSAPYQNDFIELFNRSTSSVSLNGWSVQIRGSDCFDMGGDGIDERQSRTGSVLSCQRSGWE
jgi:hypothetical protein